MLGDLSVRRAMSRLHNKTAEQRRVVDEMRQRAEALTGSGRASAKAKNKKPPPLCFVEVAGEADLKQGFFPDGMLSGVAIGVSDALDVLEFRTRYGAESPLLHQMPHTEFAFVSWLRRRGARFIGKLACKTPLTMGEASVLVPEHPAAAAVHLKACNYAIGSALMGPAALSSPVHYDVAAFKPTAQCFATFTGGYRLSIPSMSIGITAARLDDIFYLWEVFTSAIQPGYFLDESQREPGGGGSSTGTDQDSKTHGVSGSSSSSSSTRTRTSVSAGSSNRSGGGVAAGGAARPSRSVSYMGFDKVSMSGSPKELRGRHTELSVGYPADWIDSLCQERLLSADEFRRRILRLVTTQNAMRKNELLEVIPLTLDVDLEVVFKAIQTISLYELSRAVDGLFAPAGHGGGRASSSRPSTMSQSGLLDELPDELVPAIFNGRALTSLDYQRALRTRENVARATAEQFRDVDLIVTPILSEPYVSGSMRSIAPLLPFSLGGNPMVSVQLEADLPVALIGELGRDTGLFEDSTTFLQFVRGTSPPWWRRKFMS
ncbi:putative amidase [Trypanosoma conorhini]|uniref:Putative amidase n=1 Tax=Trypanosoma conorhini TaxID=83891 RepID=A0A3R7S6M7_9TRYP|nr:putative amidase [Trypanosoma conorhini]RNF22576.1 putative amidase [Trypanosoma conorhini]